VTTISDDPLEGSAGSASGVGRIVAGDGKGAASWYDCALTLMRGVANTAQTPTLARFADRPRAKRGTSRQPRLVILKLPTLYWMRRASRHRPCAGWTEVPRREARPLAHLRSREAVSARATAVCRRRCALVWSYSCPVDVVAIVPLLKPTTPPTGALKMSSISSGRIPSRLRRRPVGNRLLGKAQFIPHSLLWGA
jgi:hypothetical protein